ncbi:inner-membrane translocator [Halobacillus rhizosphaerae]|uniref:inner-membrane translocator n=1 Tax=Halobacillus rhizosphaerae TaxID=3064889 RepID=UPI00398ABA51
MQDLDGAISIIIFCLLILANWYAIKWYRIGRLPLWGSGLWLVLIGVIVGILIGALLAGSSGGWGVMYGVLVGYVIVGNGLLLILAGLAVTIGKRLSKKNNQA